MEYIDNVLIKLKRKYSKDETVAALTKRLKEVETENGKLKAEIQHLEHELKNKSDREEVLRLARVEVRKEELYNNYLERNKKLKKEVRRLRESNAELISKIGILKENNN